MPNSFSLLHFFISLLLYLHTVFIFDKRWPHLSTMSFMARTRLWRRGRGRRKESSEEKNEHKLTVETQEEDNDHSIIRNQCICIFMSLTHVLWFTCCCCCCFRSHETQPSHECNVRFGLHFTTHLFRNPNQNNKWTLSLEPMRKSQAQPSRRRNRDKHTHTCTWHGTPKELNKWQDFCTGDDKDIKSFRIKITISEMKEEENNNNETTTTSKKGKGRRTRKWECETHTHTQLRERTSARARAWVAAKGSTKA